MDTSIAAGDIGLRLLLTVIAGLAFGYDRGEHGKTAGMRTTLLVCLAASVAMIQVNLLLPTVGRSSDSFVMNDLMRFPLGILTGVGFIGGGVILRHDNIVIGVTTAATIWFVTVVGLCLGGGQLGLGIAATVLGLLALQGMKLVERRLYLEHHARLALTVATDGPSEDMIRERLKHAAIAITGNRIVVRHHDAQRELVFSVKQARLAADTRTPEVINALAKEAGVLELRWDALR